VTNEAAVMERCCCADSPARPLGFHFGYCPKGYVPPDTRVKCVEDGCEEKTLDGNRRCHAHYIDAVL
jgi:hypothetical protein